MLWGGGEGEGTKGSLPSISIQSSGLPLGILNLAKIKPYQRGFFCNDDSIKYLFHDSTITSTVLYTVGFTLPIFSIILGDTLSVFYNHLHSNSFVRNNYIATIYEAIGTFIFGAAASQLLADIAKYSIGRLHPRFLAVCQPDWTQINLCLGYIENFSCQGDKAKINEGRLSFYSDHSSFSMYCMLFLAIAMDIKAAKQELKEARTVLQMDELKCRKRVLRRLGVCHFFRCY
ncbi:phospholipid phosphatase 1-like [Aptenodytes patagonicus]|uniref:phospholipid phosphatase 1-like n=1 Tax=Aptenodytes patagonicus TaxID=9234 RepID=UPI003FA04635